MRRFDFLLLNHCQYCSNKKMVTLGLVYVLKVYVCLTKHFTNLPGVTVTDVVDVLEISAVGVRSKNTEQSDNFKNVKFDPCSNNRLEQIHARE